VAAVYCGDVAFVTAIVALLMKSTALMYGHG
jgi:hypothetical protein